MHALALARSFALVLALTFALAPAARAARPRPTPALSHGDAAARIVGGALTDGHAFALLRELTDHIGPRLSGSKGAEAAVVWAVSRLRDDGLSVRLEKVMVPHWVRGEEFASIISAPAPENLTTAEGATFPPQPYKLAITALGGSKPTPAGGVEAEVIEASSLAEVAALGEKVRGKIVLFQHDMSVAADYGKYAGLRSRGPVEVGKLGGAAALVRSLSTASLRSAHTGATSTNPESAPSAAVSTEDAELLHRLLQRGQVRVRLQLGCQTLPDVESANVIVEVKGREKPSEIVLIGGHLDSWDLAQGAMDDGAGAVAVMETMDLLAQLHPAPRRTVRGVLFMNEENGLRGGEAYAAAHRSDKHVAAIEVDGGHYHPTGLRVKAAKGGVELMRPWMTPLAGLGILDVLDGDAGGADLSTLDEAVPMPLVGFHQDAAHYFDLHHGAADTLDKVKPHDLAALTAALAWTTWALAEMPEVLGVPEKK